MGCCGGTAAVHEVHAPQRECDYLPHHAVQWCPHAFLGAHRAWCSAMDQRKAIGHRRSGSEALYIAAQPIAAQCNPTSLAELAAGAAPHLQRVVLGLVVRLVRARVRIAKSARARVDAHRVARDDGVQQPRDTEPAHAMLRALGLGLGLLPDCRLTSPVSLAACSEWHAAVQALVRVWPRYPT